MHRFRTEAEAAARLQHPNIVAIHEVGEIEGLHYFSMDYVEGPSLAELTREGTLEPERAARYVEIIAGAVHYAHQRGILHRDLKPANVLIDASDQPRITDFGLAKRLDGDGGVTLSGQVLGAPSYMPPEQAGGHWGQVGVPSDVYALGAILYHLLTGRPPFVGETIAEVLSKVQTEEPQPPRELNPGVPAELEAICLKCLRKEPRRRYASAAELAEDLRRWREGERVLARRVGGVGRWCREHPWVLAGACLLLLLSPLAYLWLSGAGSQSEPLISEESTPSPEPEETSSEVVTNALPKLSVVYVTNMLTNVVFVTVTQGVSVVTQRTEVLTENIMPAWNIGVVLPPPHAYDPWLTRDLVAYYPFNGDALDYSGYGNHGNIFGATFTNGVNGGGCRFNGIHDFIRVPQSPSLNLGGPMTMSVWLCAERTTFSAVLEKEFGFRGYNIHHGKFFHARIDGAASNCGTIPSGQWVHLAAVFTGNSLQQFINGSLVRTIPAKRLTPKPWDLYFGCWLQVPSGKRSRYLKGTLDEVRIYRRALTPSEVMALYLAK